MFKECDVDPDGRSLPRSSDADERAYKNVAKRLHGKLGVSVTQTAIRNAVGKYKCLGCPCTRVSPTNDLSSAPRYTTRSASRSASAAPESPHTKIKSSKSSSDAADIHSFLESTPLAHDCTPATKRAIDALLACSFEERGPQEDAQEQGRRGADSEEAAQRRHG